MDARSLLDDALEITIAGSFSRLGIAARRRLHGWSDPEHGALEGRTVLVTGPTSGLGRAVTDGLAVLGARVVLVGRSASRLEGVRDELVQRHGSDRFPTVVADMARAASVRAAVEHVLATEQRLDVLVDNAGAINDVRRLTEDGIEATLAISVVNPFILVAGLLPLLQADDGGLVVAVTSGGMYAQRLPLDDLQYERGPYDGVRAYARAKRAQVALIREWSRRSRASKGGGGEAPGGPAGSRVRFAAMHPGWADTPGLAGSMPGFHRLMRPVLRTPAEGADTILWLAAGGDSGAPDGRLFLDRRARPFDRLPGTALDAADRRRLWDLVVALSGLPDPAPDRPPGW